MSKDLSNYRKSYEKRELLEKDCPDNPTELFQKWFTNADNSDLIEETNAMTISTIGNDGFPKSRVVLLKEYSLKGFIFYIIPTFIYTRNSLINEKNVSERIIKVLKI